MLNNPHLIFEQFEKTTVLIVGDVMMDRYLTGQINRISPEAPVPVVLHQHTDNRLGGAANVALNVKALGGKPILCSVIGKDENATLFKSLLPQNNISSEGIIEIDDRITTVKTRVIASNQHILRVDRETTDDLKNEEAFLFLEMIKNILNENDIDVILLQDYNKGVLTPFVIRGILKEAKKRKIPTAVDPKLKNFFEYKAVTLFKPNLKEVNDALPMHVKAEPASLQYAAQSIRSILNNKMTLITLSEKGIFVDNDLEQKIIGTQPRNIADVCGAGDTVISLAAMMLPFTLDMRDIAVLSNLAGGQVCEKVGVVPVDVDQLRREYANYLKLQD